MLSLALGAGGAHAFRDDLPNDPERDCVAGAIPASAEYREHCALAAIERACTGDPSKVVQALASALGVSGVQVNKAIGRHTLASLEQGDLCARGEAQRRQVITLSRVPKKVPTESAKPWLLRELGGRDGVIDVAAVARALEERSEVIARPQAKRAGLPGAPAGWTNLSGYTQSAGRINHILFTSGTGNDILAASDGGGIWRSANGGTSWTAIDDFLGSLSITNLAKAGNDANTIYAGTNAYGSHTYFPFGVIKSTDGGTTWAQVAATNPSTNSDFEYVLRIAVNPGNSQHVLAASLRGAYETFNGGTTWTKVGNVSTMATFVAFHPTDGNRAAIAYQDGTLRFTTAGNLQSASSTVTVRAGGRYMKFAYAKSDVSRMYALVADATDSATHLYTSTTGGAAWTSLAAHDTALTSAGIFYNGGYLYYTGGLWVDPVTPTRVAVFEAWAAFAADINADPALPTTWKRLISGWVDFHGIVEHPGYDGAANRIVFFMDDGGLYRVGDVNLLNDLAQFTRLDSGMTVTQVYSVSGHGGNPILGAQDVAPRVFRTAPPGDNTLKWRFLQLPADHPTCPNCSWIGDGTRTAASTSNASVLYGSHQYMNLIRSNDGGATAISIVSGTAITEGRGIATPNFNAGFIAPFVLDPSNQSRMYAGGNSLWRSNDVDSGNPPTWQAIRAPLNDNPNCTNQLLNIVAIAVAPSDPNVVWIAYDCLGRVFKSTNALQGSPTFTEVTTLPVAAGNRSKATIMIDAANPNVVWIGLGQYQAGTLFKTTDGGATLGNWTTIAGLPGAPVYSLLQHPASGTLLYAATGVGLFASDNGGSTWSTSNEGPANVVVRSLDWNSTGASAELLVGTFGRGVFKATVSFVTLAASTTTLVSTPASPATAGTSVSFTATVSGASGTATGSVIFRDGVVDIGTVALNGSAQAALVTSALAVGSHSITANYQGNSTYAASASSALSFTVASVTSTTTLVSTPASPATAGTAVTFTATVSGASGTATGSVIFRDGVINIGTVTLNGSAQAVLATSALAVGTHSITANYQGNSTYAASASSPLSFTVTAANPPRLANIATRMQVLTGNDVMIAGFIIGGSTAKTIVVNVAGPSLSNFGIANPLANPTLTLVRSSDNAVIATNDNWQSAANAAQIQASGFQPNNPFEPAIMMTLAPGAYTAIVQGVGGTGVGLIGVFEVDHPEVPLINISTRGQVLTGNDVMIAGFIIQGSGPQTVVVNVAGPSLVNFGIVNPLANPTLTLVRSSDNAVIATNDNWQSAANAAQIQASGFQPNNPLEPAIMMTLAPGAYTAIVQGVGGGTGVGLVGVFTAP